MIIIKLGTFRCSPINIRGNANVDLTFRSRSHRRTAIKISYKLLGTTPITWNNGLKTIEFDGNAERIFQNYSNVTGIMLNGAIPPFGNLIELTVTDLTDGLADISSTTINIP
jgi:hypothetical protein